MIGAGGFVLFIEVSIDGLDLAALAEGGEDPPEPAALFNEQIFPKIHGANGTGMCDGNAQVDDAGLEVIHEAGDGGGQLLLETPR